MGKQPHELHLEAEQYLDNIKLYSSRWGKAMLIAGGSLFLTYRIIKAIAKKKSSSIENDPVQLKSSNYQLAKTQPSSRLYRLIKQQISVFLLAIARQKLAELMKQRNLANGR